jgi:hypothetical protein
MSRRAQGERGAAMRVLSVTVTMMTFVQGISGAPQRQVRPCRASEVHQDDFGRSC